MLAHAVFRDARVHVTLVRNELLQLNPIENAKYRLTPGVLRQKDWMCDWQQEAISADLIVLNRGMRYRQTPLFEEEMKQLIRELALARRGGARLWAAGQSQRRLREAGAAHKQPAGGGARPRRTTSRE